MAGGFGDKKGAAYYGWETSLQLLAVPAVGSHTVQHNGKRLVLGRPPFHSPSLPPTHTSCYSHPAPARAPPCLCTSSPQAPRRQQGPAPRSCPPHLAAAVLAEVRRKTCP